VKLAVIGGLRVSEIFGLRRGRVKDGYVEIRERVCKRDMMRRRRESGQAGSNFARAAAGSEAVAFVIARPWRRRLAVPFRKAVHTDRQ